MKLIIDIDDNEYELLNKTGIEIDWNMAFHGKEKDREMTFAIFELVMALKNGEPYEGQSRGDLISREALLKRVDEERKYLLARGLVGAEHILVHHCLPLIDGAPTVYPKQGEWKFKKFDEKTGIPNSDWCPFCGMVKAQVYDNFCGNCGADMRKGGAEE